MSKYTTNMCKGIAIILMYIHHLFYSWDTIEGYNIVFAPFSADRMIWIASICKVCVSIFVFLTGYGYVMSSKGAEEDIGEKNIKRFYRLMFGFWFIFILAQMTSFLGRSQVEVYGKDVFYVAYYFIIDALGMANFFGTPTFNDTWWYMPYAILLVFITPLLIKFIRTYGEVGIIIAVMLPNFMGFQTEKSFWRYLLALVLGIYCAEFNILQKSFNIFKKRRFLEFLIIMISSGLLILIRQRIGIYYITEPLLATVIIYIVYRYIGKIKGVRGVLDFIGKHSMNMFLLHTFIKAYYFGNFTYSFKYWWLIVFMLILSTLLISILIEFMKRCIKYNRLERYVAERSIRIIKALDWKY